MTLLRTGVPPLACFTVDFFQNVGSGKSRNGDESDLLLDDITAGLQEGLELGHALVEALALPLDLRVTHVASPSRRRRTAPTFTPSTRYQDIYICIYVYHIQRHWTRTVGSSILLMTTIKKRTPKVLQSMACSRVWPPLSKPVSNSPRRAEMTRMPTSAWAAPEII